MSTANDLPLSGITVLDFSRLVPGPFCSLILAELGATVIKVEDVEAGDMVRMVPPMHESGKGTLFELLNRDKQSVAINLKHEDGRHIAQTLAARADIILEGFRPGVPKKLGIDYATLTANNAGLIYLSLTGYGQETSKCQKAGHDLNYLGLSGFIANNCAGDIPALPGTQLADLASGSLMATISILAALIARSKSGRGRYIDLSITHGFVGLMPMIYAAQERFGEHHGFADFLFGANPSYGIYKTQDGLWITLAALEPKFWFGFCQAAELAELFELNPLDGEDSQRIRASLEAFFASHPRTALIDRFRNLDCCVEPVLTLTEAIAALDEQKYRVLASTATNLGFPYPCAIPALGQAKLASPVKRPAPLLGEHTFEVFRTFAIGSDAQLQSWEKSGVILNASAQR